MVFSCIFLRDSCAKGEVVGPVFVSFGNVWGLSLAGSIIYGIGKVFPLSEI